MAVIKRILILLTISIFIFISPSTVVSIPTALRPADAEERFTADAEGLADAERVADAKRYADGETLSARHQILLMKKNLKGQFPAKEVESIFQIESKQLEKRVAIETPKPVECPKECPAFDPHKKPKCSPGQKAVTICDLDCNCKEWICLVENCEEYTKANFTGPCVENAGPKSCQERTKEDWICGCKVKKCENVCDRRNEKIPRDFKCDLSCSTQLYDDCGCKKMECSPNPIPDSLRDQECEKDEDCKKCEKCEISKPFGENCAKEFPADHVIKTCQPKVEKCPPACPGEEKAFVTNQDKCQPTYQCLKEKCKKCEVETMVVQPRKECLNAFQCQRNTTYNCPLPKCDFCRQDEVASGEDECGCPIINCVDVAVPSAGATAAPSAGATAAPSAGATAAPSAGATAGENVGAKKPPCGECYVEKEQKIREHPKCEETKVVCIPKVAHFEIVSSADEIPSPQRRLFRPATETAIALDPEAFSATFRRLSGESPETDSSTPLPAATLEGGKVVVGVKEAGGGKDGGGKLGWKVVADGDDGAKLKGKKKVYVFVAAECSSGGSSGKLCQQRGNLISTFCQCSIYDWKPVDQCHLEQTDTGTGGGGAAAAVGGGGGAAGAGEKPKRECSGSRKCVAAKPETLGDACNKTLGICSVRECKKKSDMKIEDCDDKCSQREIVFIPDPEFPDCFTTIRGVCKPKACPERAAYAAARCSAGCEEAEETGEKDKCGCPDFKCVKKVACDPPCQHQCQVCVEREIAGKACGKFVCEARCEPPGPAECFQPMTHQSGNVTVEIVDPACPVCPKYERKCPKPANLRRRQTLEIDENGDEKEKPKCKKDYFPCGGGVGGVGGEAAVEDSCGCRVCDPFCCCACPAAAENQIECGKCETKVTKMTRGGACQETFCEQKSFPPPAEKACGDCKETRAKTDECGQIILDCVPKKCLAVEPCPQGLNPVTKKDICGCDVTCHCAVDPICQAGFWCSKTKVTCDKCEPTTRDIDNCAKKPCKHGTCQNKLNDFSCTCESGWEGKKCDTEKIVEELSKCERQRKVGRKANENVSKKEDKVFVPSCDSDGSFNRVQCDESEGLCWCASSDGEEIKDTRVKGKPKCPSGVECYDSADGTDYRGSLDKTNDGRLCMAWDKVAALEGEGYQENNPQSKPEAGLTGNFCRNPDKDANGPWCYTIQGNGAYGYCELRKCPDSK